MSDAVPARARAGRTTRVRGRLTTGSTGARGNREVFPTDGVEPLACALVQPMPPAPQQHQRRSVPRPRAELRTRPYPGPYAYPHPGPDRPFPEPCGGGPMPVAARLAGVLGLTSVVPLALLVVAAVALGGLRSDAGAEWWLYPLLAAPVVQLWGAVELLGGRSWQVLAAGCLPGAALLAWLVTETVVSGGVLGLGWWVLALAGSPLTLLLTLLPSVRLWVAARRRPVHPASATA